MSCQPRALPDILYKTDEFGHRPFQTYGDTTRQLTAAQHEVLRNYPVVPALMRLLRVLAEPRATLSAGGCHVAARIIRVCVDGIESILSAIVGIDVGAQLVVRRAEMVARDAARDLERYATITDGAVDVVLTPEAGALMRAAEAADAARGQYTALDLPVVGITLIRTLRFVAGGVSWTV